MQMHTVGNTIKITLEQGDTYEGGEAYPQGASLHKFILSTGQPLVMIRTFAQIMEIETFDGWRVDQMADGTLRMGPTIEKWKERHAQGMGIEAARAWQDYPSRSTRTG